MDLREAIQRVGSVVNDLRSALLDAALQRPRNRGMQAIQFLLGQAVGRAFGMEARMVERLVDVDIAEPRQYALVQESQLHGDAPPSKAGSKIVTADRAPAHRFRAKTKRVKGRFDVGRRKEPEPPELSDIAEIGDDATGEPQDEMGCSMGIRPQRVRHGVTGNVAIALGCVNRKLPCQLEMHHQAETAGAVDHQNLSPSPRSEHLLPEERIKGRERRVAEQLRQAEIDLFDLPSDQRSFHDPTDRFNLR